MKKTLYVISTLIIMLLLSGCTSTLRQRLQEADACMESCPDSALYILDSIDISTVTNEYDRALYKLLLTQAREKNYHFEKNDSLISEAVRYYDDNNDKNLSMRAHYYKGAINLNSGNLTTALRENLEALNLAEDLADTLYMARCHDEIASIYHGLHNIDIALIHRKKAYTLFKKRRKEDNARFALIDIAREHAALGNITQSLNVLDSLSINYSTCDSVFTGILNQSYIQPYIKDGKYDKAFEKYQKSKHFWNAAAYEMQNYPETAELFAKCNMPDSARHYLLLERATNPNWDESQWYHSAKYELYKSENRPDSAIAELEKWASLAFESLNQTLKNEASFTERDYHSYRANVEKEKADKYLSNFIYAFIIYLFLTTIFFIFHKEKIRRKKIEVENEMYKIREMSEKLIKNENINLKQNLLIQKLFKNRFKTLNALANCYFDKKDSELLRKSIINDFENEIIKLRQPQFMTELKDIANECNDNIILRLKNQMPKFKEKDINLLTLVLTGFSSRAVCLFIDINIGNYYNKLSRIKARIAKSEAPDKDFFLQSFFQ